MLVSILLSVATIAPSYTALLDSADTKANAHQWVEASELYREALKSNPASPLNSKLFANLGICLSNLEQYDDAIEAFGIALVKEPSNARILSHRASAYLLNGEIPRALEDIDDALAIDSLAPAPLRMRGQIHLAENDLIGAREDFSRLQAADPKDAWGPAGLADVELQSGNPSEAVPLLRKALLLEENPDFRLSLISALFDVNKLKDAEDAIRESLLLYPEMGELYVMRARLHKLLHQNGAAEADKKTATEYGVDPQIIERYMPSGSL